MSRRPGDSYIPCSYFPMALEYSCKSSLWWKNYCTSQCLLLGWIIWFNACSEKDKYQLMILVLKAFYIVKYTATRTKCLLFSFLYINMLLYQGKAYGVALRCILSICYKKTRRSLPWKWAWKNLSSGGIVLDLEDLKKISFLKISILHISDACLDLNYILWKRGFL